MDDSPPPWQAVFFDFDGVIADSTAVKVQAFATLFAPHGPEVQEAVIRYHLDNGGMPRRDKIRHCFSTFADRNLSEAELDSVGRAFSALVLDQVIAAPLMPGAMPTLHLLRTASVPAFVVSGTPEEEMRLIVDRKGLAPYFLEVHGSPRPKPAILEDVLSRHRYRAGGCLFIGDALADYRAARGAELHFLGIVPEGRASIFPAEVVTSPIVTLVW